jgi:hypothetical protein
MSPRASLGPGSGMRLKAWALDAARRRTPAANGKQRMRAGLFKRRILLARRLSKKSCNILFIIDITRSILRCCPPNCPRSRVATPAAIRIPAAARRQQCGSSVRLRRSSSRSPLLRGMPGCLHRARPSAGRKCAIACPWVRHRCRSSFQGPSPSAFESCPLAAARSR